MTLGARVDEGIDCLDDNIDIIRLNWREWIDLDSLDMAHVNNCVLGQLFGEFDDGAKSLNIEDPRVLGFDVFSESYAELTNVWRRKLGGSNDA